MHSRDNADSEYVLYVRQTIRVRTAEFISNKVHSLTHLFSHTQLIILVKMCALHISQQYINISLKTFGDLVKPMMSD